MDQEKHPLENIEASEVSSHSDKQSASKRENHSTEDGLVKRSQNTAVRLSKFLVLGVIGFTALCFGAAVYYSSNEEEREDYETKFNDMAIEITQASQRELHSVFGAATSLATTLTSHTLDSGLAWPEFLLSHFERHGMSLAELARIEQLTIAPLVPSGDVQSWQEYAGQHHDWIQEGVSTRLGDQSSTVGDISSFVYRFDGEGVTPQTGTGVNGSYAPVWQQYPAPLDPSIVNFDLLSHPSFATHFEYLSVSNRAVLSDVVDLNFLLQGSSAVSASEDHSFFLHPIYVDFSSDAKLVGFIVGVLSWETLFDDQISESSGKVSVLLHNSCGTQITYEIDGPEAVFVGPGDLHDTEYDSMEVSVLLNEAVEGLDQCIYRISVYPTDDFHNRFDSSSPWLYAAFAVFMFSFTSIVFTLYDVLVQRRQRHVVDKAERTNQLVSTLFPSNVRDRLLGQNTVHDDVMFQDDNKTVHSNLTAEYLEKTRVAGETGPVDPTNPYETRPIADLFPEATVLFADIVGFTAWSSVREPTQVFTLLETLYHSFDTIAKRRRVFKVETVGLPDPRPDHASVMARFARECLTRMNELTKLLETTLGPDTGDLSMRVGLHSGPVTAGVLRGDKSRFQLFGDTVNTAARIEATGQRNRIHLSQDTADLLKNARKAHWIEERVDIVKAKGKGELQTYWLLQDGKKSPGAPSDTVQVSDQESAVSSEERDERDDAFVTVGLKEEESDPEDDDKIQGLVSWNADLLMKLLRRIVARRTAVMTYKKETGTETEDDSLTHWAKTGTAPMHEVSVIIHLPEFDKEAAKHEPDPDSVEIPDEVAAQLKDFVQILSTMYRINPFHNFEHASHVTMSVIKLLSRIVAPSNHGLGESVHAADKETKGNIASTLHDHTYGITSDPLTQFACVLAALIHDVDHVGVPNAQLIKEKVYTARVYNNKSVAEQNSVDVAWDLLMDVNFSALRKAICATVEEQRRFRRLVVNSVMATDICDKQLKDLRNIRWERAFSESPAMEESKVDRVNRKATIVIEHLIQASDVAHTMQHWHIYRKWNERLFHEMLLAYRAGRAETDPAEGWYKGELGFFDYYIIPLAKKLKNCGVFGVSSDEYLNYAKRNRQEWERKGKQIVAEMIRQYSDVYGHAVVKLDGIQDADAPALRSMLLSSDTDHCSSHVTRAMHDSLGSDGFSFGGESSFASMEDVSVVSKQSIDTQETGTSKGSKRGRATRKVPVRSRALSKSSDENTSMKALTEVLPGGKTSETTSATTAINEWGNESADSFYGGGDNDDSNANADAIAMDFVSLGQRIKTRLVGNRIKNTRAYDKQPSVAEMSFQ